MTVSKHLNTLNRSVYNHYSRFNRYKPAGSPYKKMSDKTNPAPLVWIDCEMTGLDSKKDRIIEICCLLTDSNLNLIEPDGFESVIHCPKEVMDRMSQWCVDHHGASGLTKRVIESSNKLEDVENDLLTYLKKYIPLANKGVLAGNSIHQDRLFLVNEFPKVIDYLHYRQLDVSTLTEIAYRHNPRLLKQKPAKKHSHTARSDILESIEELKWYYENYLKSDQEGQATEHSTS